MMAEVNEKRITPMKAIRLHCLECSNGSAYEVTHCPCTQCNLWVFRSGHNPYDKRRGVSTIPPWMRNAQPDALKTVQNTDDDNADGECVAEDI